MMRRLLLHELARTDRAHADSSRLLWAGPLEDGRFRLTPLGLINSALIRLGLILEL